MKSLMWEAHWSSSKVHRAEFWGPMPLETTVMFCPMIVPYARSTQTVLPVGTNVGFCAHE